MYSTRMHKHPKPAQQYNIIIMLWIPNNKVIAILRHTNYKEPPLPIYPDFNKYSHTYEKWENN